MGDHGVTGAISVYRRLLDAWNRQHARGFAAEFALDGSAVGFDGSMMNGRAQIESALAGIFAHHRTAAYVARVQEVRDLAPGITLIRAVAGMVPPGGTDINPAVNAVQTLVLVGKGGDRRIALLQNTPAAFHGRPELADELTANLNAVARAGELVVGP